MLLVLQWHIKVANWSLYWDYHQSCVRLEIGAGIWAVRTTDAVTTGEVICYNVIVRLRSLPMLVKTLEAAQRPVTCEEGSFTLRKASWTENCTNPPGSPYICWMHCTLCSNENKELHL